jgi:hypothetical protein
MKVILTDEEVALTIELLSWVKDIRALKLISRLREACKDTREADAYREIAKETKEDEGYCEVDDHATVSIGEDGAYVQAWLFVRKEDIRPGRKAA